MRVSVVAVDGTYDSGLAAVLDVFEMANQLRGQLPQPTPPWQVTCVSPHGTVRTAAGHAVETVTPEMAGKPDLLIMPGVGRMRPQALLDWISSPEREPLLGLAAQARADGVALAAACTATFVLGESGVLHGLPATTTWWLAPYFRERYPAVQLDETHMLMRADGITTVGAAMAHMDLALALVRDTSPVLADLASRYLLIDSRPTQGYYAITSHLARTDPLVNAFERWIRQHLEEPWRLADAAKSLGTTERSLQRAVDRVLGIPPVQFAQRIRLEQATHLLRTTDMTTMAVARKVGYESATTLTTLLRKRLGITPGQLRRQKH
ncbi:GlxA family transcriptional regulator [Streptomyces sp. NPDC002962]|uniref:GlxA family transcriptional regulator n=1 Tax=Streptomyces sp. NPDC002962 TaxID=3364674 RepID=UPI0036B5EEC4